MKKGILSVLALVGFSLSACGGSAGTCSYSTDSKATWCIQYTGSAYTGSGAADAVKTACTGIKGTYGTTECSKTDAWGVCTMNKGQAGEIKYTYYKAFYTTVDAAKAACGTNDWVAN